MNDMDILVPGLPLKLMAQTSVKAKAKSVLVGFKRNEYVAIERPTNNGQSIHLADGTSWLINFIAKGNVFNFTSTLLGSSSFPVPLSFLSYPQNIQRTSLRQEQRIPVQIETTLRLAGSPIEAPVPGLIRDISSGGCQLLTALGCEAGQMVQLNLKVAEGKQLEGVQGEVKNRISLGARHVLGISFAPGFQSEAYMSLTAFLKTLEELPVRFEG